MSERIAKFYHGTTVSRAQHIADACEFAIQETFFGLGDSNRDLAVFFAQRTSAKRPAEGGPALVIVTMEETAFNSMRQQALIRPIPFDAEDRHELNKRLQWVLEPFGVQRFNREADDWEWVRL